jgi:branched-chain amino acid aminotransferase
MGTDRTVVSIDFEKVSREKAQINIFDRGFLFGDSVYEVVRAYEGTLFAFDRHFQRLNRSAKAIGFKLPFDGPRLKAHFQEMVEELNGASCYVRVVVTRGAYGISLYPPESVEPTTVVIAGEMDPWPEDYYKEGISLVIVGIRRNPRGALNPMIKSGNYLNNVLAAMEARRAGAVDAVMLNAEGNVTESSTANVFLVKGGRLITPPVEAGILDGVSRYIAMELAEKNGIPVELDHFGPSVLGDADECFLTSTTREVMPVRKVDDYTFSAPGPVTSRLMALYREYVQSGRE